LLFDVSQPRGAYAGHSVKPVYAGERPQVNNLLSAVWADVDDLL
jgi:hypothetical protein